MKIYLVQYDPAELQITDGHSTKTYYNFKISDLLPKGCLFSVFLNTFLSFSPGLTIFLHIFSINLLAFYRQHRSVTLLAIYSVVDSGQRRSVRLSTTWRPLLHVFEVSVKKIILTASWSTSRFILKQLNYSFVTMDQLGRLLAPRSVQKLTEPLLLFRLNECRMSLYIVSIFLL